VPSVDWGKKFGGEEVNKKKGGKKIGMEETFRPGYRTAIQLGRIDLLRNTGGKRKHQ